VVVHRTNVHSWSIISLCDEFEIVVREDIIGEAEAATVSVTPATALSAGSALSFPVRQVSPVSSIVVGRLHCRLDTQSGSGSACPAGPRPRKFERRLTMQ
jgi:hypothetical protein